ncbi:MAG: metallophosphoesterase [Candidatus Acidiferrum sp.]
MSTLIKNALFAALIAVVLAVSCSSRTNEEKLAFTEKSAAVELKVPDAFRFVAYGDPRFHDPSDTEPSNAAVRRALVAAIDKENPAFVSIGGDIVYNGYDGKDWQVWDTETAVWREHKIPIYPAIGNHDLHGNLQTALGNYFARFPELKESRYYSVRVGNAVMLVLDSALDELSGPQGEWLRDQLDHLPSSTDFVFMVFHHPPYTSSSDDKTFGGGHSARATEQALGKSLEERQQHTRARFVVFNGHVHNYERHEHGGVTYFVTGGGGAHPYPIVRHNDDLYKDNGVNYHYLLAEVDHNRLKVTMHKVEIKDGKEVWSEPDSVTIAAPIALPAAAD